MDCAPDADCLLGSVPGASACCDRIMPRMRFSPGVTERTGVIGSSACQSQSRTNRGNKSVAEPSKEAGGGVRKKTEN
eukprot:1194987-Prorocentrum_minimum.AAC.1